jgi:LacI family transcriptional regulator
MISGQTAAEIYAELTAQTMEQQRLLDRRDENAGRCVGIVYTHWLLAEEDHVFFGPIVRAFRNRAAALGWHVFSGAPGEHWLEENLVEASVAAGADAIVVLGGADGNPDILRSRWGNLPAVFIEYDTLGARSGHVGLDNEAAFSSVVFHLHEMGRSRIAHISGLLDTRVGAERLSAYRDTLRRLGYPLPPEYMETGDFYPELAYESTKRLLALPEPPDAIACACDVQAVAAIKAIEEAGLRVPEDIAVTGFDDAPFAVTMTPSLTTVRQPVEAMGVHAFDAAAAMVADPELRPPIVQLDGELVVRESSGAAVLA